MVVAPAEHHVAHVTDDDFLGHVRRTVEHNVLGRPAALFLQRAQECDRRRHVRNASHRFHAETVAARLEALVDLLQPQETCANT